MFDDEDHASMEVAKTVMFRQKHKFDLVIHPASRNSGTGAIRNVLANCSTFASGSFCKSHFTGEVLPLDYSSASSAVAASQKAVVNKNACACVHVSGNLQLSAILFELCVGTAGLTVWHLDQLPSGAIGADCRLHPAARCQGAALCLSSL